jgi:hypothetical protein
MGAHPVARSGHPGRPSCVQALRSARGRLPGGRAAPLPKSFFAFLWENTRGLRPLLLVLTLLTAVIGAFEALLFSMMAHMVDLLATVKPAELWAREGGTLALLAGVMVLSVGVSTGCGRW